MVFDLVIDNQSEVCGSDVSDVASELEDLREDRAILSLCALVSGLGTIASTIVMMGSGKILGLSPEASLNYVLVGITAFNGFVTYLNISDVRAHNAKIQSLQKKKSHVIVQPYDDAIYD